MTDVVFISPYVKGIVESLPSVGIDDERYVKASGKLQNSDLKWREFVDSL